MSHVSCSARRWTFSCLVTVLLASPDAFAASPQDARQQAQAIVSKMTLDEKIQQLHGAAPRATAVATPTAGPIEQQLVMPRRVDGVPRLGIPAFYITNGPSGVGMGDADPQKPATALPSPIALAATWSTQAAYDFGKLVGFESRALGNTLLEAPTINIARVPQNGRTFEAFGEDPLLTGMLAVANIRGIQSQNTLANVKHFVANNQETDRFTVNEVIDERTLREIYLAAFERAVKLGKAASLMCAYPKINGTFNCENELLLEQVLRKEWGFEGFVSSDFFATHSTVASANAGLDLEMPNGLYFGEQMQQALASGAVTESAVDEKLVRRYTKMIEYGYFANVLPQVTIPADADNKIAQALAAEGIVLLKNAKGLLPLDTARLKSIALIGPQATKAITGGGGSSKVVALSSISPLDGLQVRVGKDIKVTLADGADIDRAARLAKAATVAIVMVGEVTSEGSDHALDLPPNDNKLVEAVLAANPDTVVVLKTGSAVLMPWIDKAATLLEAWYPGQADGAAVASILFGDVDPSGRLPLTFPAKAQDLPANTRQQWPGIDEEAHYSEGIFIGYRHFDQNHIQPLFPFGYGLSYTRFKFSNLHVTRTKNPLGTGYEAAYEVTLDVTNTGKRQGVEVVQVYLGIPSTGALPQPPKRLAGFTKIPLQPGQKRRVSIPVEGRVLASWDAVRHDWVLGQGAVNVMVGSSSRDIHLHESIELKGVR
jgi:beta-glucosidase